MMRNGLMRDDGKAWVPIYGIKGTILGAISSIDLTLACRDLYMRVEVVCHKPTMNPCSDI